MGSSSSGGNSGSSRSYPNTPPPSVISRRSYITTPSGKPIFTSSGARLQGRTNTQIARDNNRNNNNGGGGGNNNNNNNYVPPTSTPTPEPTPIVEEGGKIIDPNFYLLQKEQRSRRLGRNYFSLLGVSESFTGVKRNLLF